jgi:[acyl-carrier-protein] S-malonyltransferase
VAGIGPTVCPMPNDAATALLFPGQGSHEPEMIDLVAAEAPDLLERCLELVEDDPFARVADSTRFAQPAIFCASIAGWRRARDLAPRPVAVAGHSLGELAALVAADALDALEALELVVLRGRLMWEAGERSGGGAMLALLGASDEVAANLAAAHGVVVANQNAPGQVVLSGPGVRLDAAAEQARADGLRAMELGVTAAFHSPAMAPALGPFATALAHVELRAPAIPVISGLTGRPMTHPRRDLAGALTQPVRWTAVMRALADRGVQRFIDAGPGRVLAKLAKRNVPGAEIGALADLEGARV